MAPPELSYTRGAFAVKEGKYLRLAASKTFSIKTPAKPIIGYPMGNRGAVSLVRNDLAELPGGFSRDFARVF
jgi:hypothetical protein